VGDGGEYSSDGCGVMNVSSWLLGMLEMAEYGHRNGKH